MAKDVLGRTIDRCKETCLPLWFTVVVLVNTPANNAADTRNLETNTVQALTSAGNSTATKMVLEGGLITLGEDDRQALATYPGLEELHLDGNMVAHVPAQYFSVVPQLRVLSLSRNKISSLNPESFSGLDLLTQLDLSNNLLTNIHTQLFKQLLKIQVLRLKGNPWNCSCPLLKTVGAEEHADGSNFTCAFLKSQEVREFMRVASVCDSLTQRRSKRDEMQPVTVGFPQSSRSSPPTTDRDNSEEQTPVVSNTWKFTTCVATLALCTLTVVLCAIKGPSWYKVFHNYRHQRLQQEEDNDVFSIGFTKTSRSTTNQTFTFQPQNRQMDEEMEEDGYFEDLLMEREGEGASAKPEEAKA
ncbi:leucine-rich repeat-containing protein 19-like isoform X1 [Takifugu rubripes]|uniref:leucine-rich repeat-containing protein 19-like isoform X1 n=1 Tax=Takifugu rubripes TaxID=31033 RepID=UPI00114535B9|nr:leucine-rich repeat-containing protein 19-like isoform X1 [Takifugu rubripes]